MELCPPEPQRVRRKRADSAGPMARMPFGAPHSRMFCFNIVRKAAFFQIPKGRNWGFCHKKSAKIPDSCELSWFVYIWGVSKNHRGFSPKVDGENHGKPYFFVDVFGGKPHHPVDSAISHAIPKLVAGKWDRCGSGSGKPGESDLEGK